MQEALVEKPTSYNSFTDFFTRQLKTNVRPFKINEKNIISPVDGAISQFGNIEQSQLLQAKGKYFSLDSLLAENSTHANCKQFANGKFITMYLAPKDYHRVHMPLPGQLISSSYIPGKLFSVNEFFVDTVHEIFAKNERFIAYFAGPTGPFAVIMVGAYIVHGIHTTFTGKINSLNHNSLVKKNYDLKNQQIKLQQGSEFGYFSLGSTVILLLPNSYEFSSTLKAGQSLQMGQIIAKL